MKLLLRSIVLILTSSTLLLTSSVSAQESGVSDARFARLARGINLTGWFWYAPANTQDIQNRFSDADFQLIHDLGFTFVRIPIDLGFLLDESQANLLNPERLALLDEGLDRILALDLAVMIDLHSTSIEDSNNANYSAALEDEAFVELFLRFWRSFAAHLSARDPEKVFIEPMNEPVFQSDPSRWPPIQARLLATIRESAPEHTLVATGALWSGMDTLLELEPLDDPNIVYNFHFYEPFPFTHQGATWSTDLVRPLRGVPYPSSPEAVEPVIQGLSSGDVQQFVRDYGRERWDINRIDRRIARAAAWGQAHDVRVICTEFGAYKNYAPPADRAEWIHDVRTTFEKYGIGWAMWEYDESFGLVVQRRSGGAVVDMPVAEALGLNVG
jgi:endoglucanase